MAWQHVVGHEMMHGLSDAVAPVIEVTKQAANASLPVAMPSAEKIIELGLRGILSPQAVDNNLANLGVATTIGQGTIAANLNPAIAGYQRLWNTVYYASQELPTVTELHEISNRFLIDDPTLEALLRNYGFYDATIREEVANLRYDIPGPSDLVRFAVRHLWEPELMAKLGYNAEFPGVITDVWHHFKGLDYKLFTGPFQKQIDQLRGEDGYAAALAERYFENLGEEPTWAQAYWYAHWVLPSPTQGIDMWFRLNPERDPRWDGPEAVGKVFTYDDLQLLLRASDYPPFYRDKISAIGRPIPTIRYVRDFYRTGVYSKDDVLKWAVRWGYSPGDAKDLSDDIIKSVDMVKAKPGQCAGCKLVEQAWEVGIIGAADLQEYYARYGLTDEEALARAEATVLQRDVARAKQVIATIRSSYLSGESSDVQAQALLQGYGIQPARIQEYINDWQIERGSKRKLISAQQNIKWACQGLISYDQLTARLANLGYDQEDVQGLSAEAAICQRTNLLKAIQQAAKNAAQEQKQAIAAQKAAAQQLQQARKMLASHGSPTQLRKWFCEGLIGSPEVYDRLGFMGWPAPDIARLIGDCKPGSPGAGQGKTGPGGQPGQGP